MKRYVSTEDGYMIDTQNTEPFMIVDDYIDFNSGGRFKIKSTADTIEDLCDCYVVYEESGGFKGYHRTYNDLKLAKYSADGDTSVIYGAIWAKGEHDEPILKSVAKMNEKGEFELLEEKE